jgi:hypothetical protein
MFSVFDRALVTCSASHPASALSLYIYVCMYVCMYVCVCVFRITSGGCYIYDMEMTRITLSKFMNEGTFSIHLFLPPYLLYIHMHINIHLHIHICPFIYIYISVRSFICPFIYMYIYVRSYIYIYIPTSSGL